jgi:acyl-CoA thioester hydrolase
MKTKYELVVRSYECDGYDHVNNAVYLNYLEAARFEFLKNINFDCDVMHKAGFAIYVSRIEINYKKSAFAGDKLVIESMPVKIGAVSGDILQTIHRGNELVADAKVTWAFVDRKSGTPARIPPELAVSGLSPESN